MAQTFTRTPLAWYEQYRGPNLQRRTRSTLDGLLSAVASQGGGVQLDRGNATFTQCRIFSNVATSMGHSHLTWSAIEGGGLVVEFGQVTFVDSSVYENTAEDFVCGLASASLLFYACQLLPAAAPSSGPER